MNLSVHVFGLLLAFCRVGGCVMFMPGFSSLRVPTRSRLILALGFSLLVAPLIPGDHATRIVDLGPAAQAAAMATETLVGVAIGLVARFFFMMLEMMAVAMSNAVGLSVAFAPPIEGDQSVPTIAGMIGLVAIVLFFVAGLHAEVLRALLGSYKLVAPLQPPDLRRMLVDLVDTIASASLIGLQLAGPILLVSVIVNAGFGLLNRMAPQAPVYFISVPFVIAAGLIVLFSAEQPLFAIFTESLGRWIDRY